MSSSSMPTVDEILSKLGGAKVFSKLDALGGYWQIKVDISNIIHRFTHYTVPCINSSMEQQQQYGVSQKKGAKTKINTSCYVSNNV